MFNIDEIGKEFLRNLRNGDFEQAHQELFVLPRKAIKRLADNKFRFPLCSDDQEIRIEEKRVYVYDEKQDGLVALAVRG